MPVWQGHKRTEDRVVFLVLDDSVIPGERSKKVELLSRVYDHVIHKTVKGFNTQRNIFGSVCVKTGKHHIPVKLMFVRNRNKKSKYIVILTTDCGLADSEVIRRYGNRWSVEVFFRAIAITNEVKMHRINWYVSQRAFIKVLHPDLIWEV